MKGNPIVWNLLTLFSSLFISLKQRMLWKHCLERLVHSFSSCYSLLFITEKHHPAAAVTFHASTISTMFDDHQKSLQRIKRTELKFKALFRDTRYSKIKFLIFLPLLTRMLLNFRMSKMSVILSASMFSGFSQIMPNEFFGRFLTMQVTSKWSW